MAVAYAAWDWSSLQRCTPASTGYRVLPAPVPSRPLSQPRVATPAAAIRAYTPRRTQAAAAAQATATPTRPGREALAWAVAAVTPVKPTPAPASPAALAPAPSVLGFKPTPRLISMSTGPLVAAPAARGYSPVPQQQQRYVVQGSLQMPLRKAASPTQAATPTPYPAAHRAAAFSPEKSSAHGRPRAQSASADAEIAFGRRAERLAWDPEALKELVGRCFQEVGAGATSLDLAGLLRFIPRVCQEAELDQVVFQQAFDDFTRFDFSGDNRLQEHECYRLVKYYARKFVYSLGLHADVSVPYKTPWEDGHTLVRQLGQGAQGTLMLSQLSSGEQRCIKIIPKNQANAVSLDELKDEYRILHKMANHHVAKIFDIFQDAQSYYLVNEPYMGHDFNRLRPRAVQAGVITEDWWRSIFSQSLQGLAYLHKHALMHCDVKEPNIMLKVDDVKNPEVVLVDFGIAQEFVHPKIRISGTPGYIPPETWSEQKWYPKGDIFAMGVVFTQLVLDKVPVLDPTTQACLSGGIFVEGAGSIEDVVAFTTSRPAPLFMLDYRQHELRSFLEKLLVKEKLQRYSALQALQDPWLRSSAVGNGAGAIATAANGVGSNGTVAGASGGRLRPLPPRDASSSMPGLRRSLSPAQGDKVYAAAPSNGRLPVEEVAPAARIRALTPLRALTPCQAAYG
eukprot:TRINITY_DN1395_c0_g2_i1.p1 TRINITY_DN1395_c0_g2~~TRINITY_DN1395_c0_g2_i1.p1  ORF type:complete len:679 (+),score=150.09 TRINITY_DN1395_c0_g2_i1:37-2073(+)